MKHIANGKKKTTHRLPRKHRRPDDNVRN